MYIEIGRIDNSGCHSFKIFQALPLGFDSIQNSALSYQRMFTARLTESALWVLVGCLQEDDLQIGATLPQLNEMLTIQSVIGGCQSRSGWP